MGGGRGPDDVVGSCMGVPWYRPENSIRIRAASGSKGRDTLKGRTMAKKAKKAKGSVKVKDLKAGKDPKGGAAAIKFKK
jgi:hypothetical protein